MHQEDFSIDLIDLSIQGINYVISAVKRCLYFHLSISAGTIRNLGHVSIKT